MKLKDTFITQSIDQSQFLIAVGDGSFHGVLRNNETAALIVSCLQQDTTPERIIDAVFAEYDADRETIAADVKAVLNELRNIGALEEP